MVKEDRQREVLEGKKRRKCRYQESQTEGQEGEQKRREKEEIKQINK